MIIQRIKERWDEVKHHAVEAYNDAGGDAKQAKRLFRSRIQSYGFDPMTLFVLLQIAIKLWAWAKENGYLGAMPQGAPGFALGSWIEEIEAD